jgi:hypothetical protein
MHHLSLALANAEIARRVADAEQRRRSRSCRTGRPVRPVLTDQPGKL